MSVRMGVTVLHRASAQGKKQNLVFVWASPICGYRTEYQKSSPVFIITLSQGTGQLPEESERVLCCSRCSDCGAAGQGTAHGRWGLTFPDGQFVLGVTGDFQKNERCWVTIGRSNRFLHEVFSLLLPGSPSQSWKKHLLCPTRDFYCGTVGRVGADPQSWDFPSGEQEALGAVACAVTCFVDKLGTLLCHFISESLW